MNALKITKISSDQLKKMDENNYFLIHNLTRHKKHYFAHINLPQYKPSSLVYGLLACIEQHTVSSHFKFNRRKFTAEKVHMPYYPKLYKI